MSQRVKLSPKYQVVIPKSVREQIELHPGQEFTLIVKDGVIHLIPILPIHELVGIAEGINPEGYREEVDRY